MTYDDATGPAATPGNALDIRLLSRSEDPNGAGESNIFGNFTATGEFEDRLSLKARFTASGVYADGLIFFPSEAGETVIVQPGADMKILATNTLEDGCMAYPALDGSSIFLRTRSHLYRIGK